MTYSASRVVTAASGDVNGDGRMSSLYLSSGKRSEQLIILPGDTDKDNLFDEAIIREVSNPRMC